MVGDDVVHHSFKRTVVFNAGVLDVRIFARVLVSAVGGDLGRDFLSDDLANFILILPLDVAEMLVPRVQDVAKAIQFRLALVARACLSGRVRFWRPYPGA